MATLAPIVFILAGNKDNYKTSDELMSFSLMFDNIFSVVSFLIRSSSC